MNLENRFNVSMLLLATLIFLLGLSIIFVAAKHLSLANYTLSIAIILVLLSMPKALTKHGYVRAIKIIITIGLAVLYAYLAIVLRMDVVFLFFSWVRILIFISLLILLVPLLIVLIILRHRFREVHIATDLTLIVISVV